MIEDAGRKIVLQHLLVVQHDGKDKAADDYWTATKDYWAIVRAEWDRIANEKAGIGIQEEAETGTVISARLMQLADDIQSGKTTTARAAIEASRLIAENTRSL